MVVQKVSSAKIFPGSAHAKDWGEKLCVPLFLFPPREHVEIFVECGLTLVSGVGCRPNGVISKQSISQKFSHDLDELLCVVLRSQTN